MAHVLVLHGPNLNLLGTREPEVYGSTTLAELEGQIALWGEELGLECSFVQSNHEGALIDALHEARERADAVLVNAGALTHYSYALYDALAAIDKLTVEVHISNIHSREDWRRHSVISPAADHLIFGRGLRGYRDGLRRIFYSLAHPPERVSYGPNQVEYGELRVPAGAGPHPVAVLIHGGFWREVWTLDLMDGLATDLAARGWAAWNIEYHRVGGGGGWPTTLEDVGQAIDHLRKMKETRNLDLDNVVAIGHSAGGHLALWSAARPRLYDEEPVKAGVLKPGRVVALAAVADLAMAHSLGTGDGAVEELIRRTPAEGPRRYESASPAELVPLEAKQLIVHGDKDDSVPIEIARSYVAAASTAGDDVTFHEMPGGDHFEVIDPSSAAWAGVIEWLG